jgi:putative intracellular protease/amidase
MELSGKRVAILAADVYEDNELWYPRIRLTEAGAEVKVIGVNAGAKWEDSEVVVDGNLISSRNPGDLPAFCRAIIAWLSQL